MPQRFYLDTSIFGGVFDIEFLEETLLLFKKIKLENLICVYSDLTERELLNAPVQVRNYFRAIPIDRMERIVVTEEMLLLASKYIKENVVGQTSFDDCVHIAAATICEADILISWNFKHIVNIYRINGYNSVNINSNYKQLEIRSPKEIIRYED